MAKSEETRQHILESALRVFRQRGFAKATMREIAEAADMSVGAAYHYFPSKEALVGAYAEWMQREHERLVADSFRSDDEPASRLRALFLTKLELLRGDRKLLGALFGNLGDASAPLPVFGRRTARLRERSIALFASAFEVTSIPEELRHALGRAAWLAHLGVFLFFIHDASPGQARTRKLIDSIVSLVVGALPLLTSEGPLSDQVLVLMEGFGP